LCLGEWRIFWMEAEIFIWSHLVKWEVLGRKLLQMCLIWLFFKPALGIFLVVRITKLEPVNSTHLILILSMEMMSFHAGSCLDPKCGVSPMACIHVLAWGNCSTQADSQLVIPSPSASFICDQFGEISRVSIPTSQMGDQDPVRGSWGGASRWVCWLLSSCLCCPSESLHETTSVYTGPGWWVAAGEVCQRETCGSEEKGWEVERTLPSVKSRHM
jgi:hypothetical protein